MKAGIELDALISEKVMGWKHVKFNETRSIFNDPDSPLIKWAGGIPPDYSFKGGVPVPPYSTDIRAAWAVVEKLNLFHTRMDKEGLDIGYCLRQSLDGWEVYYRYGGAITRQPTAPLAICLTALKVVEK